MKLLDDKKITRVEVIDDTGRAYVMRGALIIDMQLQDDDRTLKIFINKKKGRPPGNPKPTPVDPPQLPYRPFA